MDDIDDNDDDNGGDGGSGGDHDGQKNVKILKSHYRARFIIHTPRGLSSCMLEKSLNYHLTSS